MPTISTQTNYWEDVEKPEKMRSDDWDIEKGEWKQTEPAGCGLAVALEVTKDVPEWLYSTAYDTDLGIYSAFESDVADLVEQQQDEAWEDAYIEYQAELQASGESFLSTREANALYSGLDHETADSLYN